MNLILLERFSLTYGNPFVHIIQVGGLNFKLEGGFRIVRCKANVFSNSIYGLHDC